MATRCQYWCRGGPCVVRSNEQIWTGLQWWPPDVTSTGLGLGWIGRGSNVQCISGGCDMVIPPMDRMNERHDWKLRLRVVKISVVVYSPLLVFVAGDGVVQFVIWWVEEEVGVKPLYLHDHTPVLRVHPQTVSSIQLQQNTDCQFHSTINIQPLQGTNINLQKHGPLYTVYVPWRSVQHRPIHATLNIECTTIRARVANKRYTQIIRMQFLHYKWQKWLSEYNVQFHDSHKWNATIFDLYSCHPNII